VWPCSNVVQTLVYYICTCQLVCTDYPSIVGFLDVQKWHKSKESKIAIHCCWFTRPVACLLYFTTLRLLVKSASQNSTKLQMSPRTKNEVVTDIAWQLVKITRHFWLKWNYLLRILTRFLLLKWAGYTYVTCMPTWPGNEATYTYVTWIWGYAYTTWERGYTYVTWEWGYAYVTWERGYTYMQPGNEAMPICNLGTRLCLCNLGTTMPTQPGNEAMPTQPGNEAIPMWPGNEVIPTWPGNEAMPTWPGNEAMPMQPGNNYAYATWERGYAYATWERSYTYVAWEWGYAYTTWERGYMHAFPFCGIHAGFTGEQWSFERSWSEERTAPGSNKEFMCEMHSFDRGPLPPSVYLGRHWHHSHDWGEPERAPH